MIPGGMGNTKVIPLADGLQVEVDVEDGRQAVATVGELATRGWNQIEGVLRTDRKSVV